MEHKTLSLSSTAQLPKEISNFFTEMVAKHISRNTPEDTPYLERFNMSISMDLERVEIETRHSVLNPENTSWAGFFEDMEKAKERQG